MMDTRKQPLKKDVVSTPKPRSYNEIIEYFDSHWSGLEDPNLERMGQLDRAFDYPSKKVNILSVAGTNGKSITVGLTARLLVEEGLSVGAFYAPHILTYNERFVINQENIANKAFVDLANAAISTAEQLGIKARTYELLTIMALNYFVAQKVDVAILEVHKGGASNPINICHAKATAITRITPQNVHITESDLVDAIHETIGIVKEGTWLVAGDQNKSHLQLIQKVCVDKGGLWAMPIRKLAALSYPFEQIHGRCAALAERLGRTYIQEFHNKNAAVIADSLLSKPKGQRGRPTLMQKRESELHPKKTIEQFWKETSNQLPGRFQLLEKEKPTILLDIASNLDALQNILVGIRLLHYQRPLKGLAIILSAADGTLQNEEFLKSIRYFFKKTSGQLFICPVESPLPGLNEDQSWQTEKVTNEIKSMKIKARSCSSFEEAFGLAKESVDARDGLVAITGSRSIVNMYWKLKGIKKFS